MSTTNELDNLANEELNKPEKPNRRKEAIAAKIAAGTFVSNNLKYTEEILIGFLDGMFQWFLVNTGACFIEEYYFDPATDKSVPYGSLKKTYGRHQTCDEIRDAIKKVLEIRLAKAALTGAYKENFAKFLLTNNFGYTSEKTQQDITLSTKEVRFKFDNPELNPPDENEIKDESEN